MMKFFRKHSKKLLAMFMCLLLISWLGGDALEYLLRPSAGGGVVAKYVGGELTQQDWKHAQQQTEWLERLALPWRSPFGQYQAGPLDLTSWLLLQKEAQRMGIHSNRTVTENTVRIYHEALSKQGRVLPSLDRLAALYNVKVEVLYDAATAFTDVVRYGSLMAKATGVSSAELRRCAEDALSQVQVKAVVLRAEMFEQADETFGDAEIREQFDKFKHHQPSGEGLSFGYLLPQRVRVQYAKIDPHKIEESMVVDQKKLDNDALYYWKGHKQDPAFQRPPEKKTEEVTTTQATQPAEPEDPPASQPTTTSAASKEEPFFTTWAEAKDAAYQGIRRKYAEERAQKLTEWLLGRAAESWDHAEIGTNGYKVAVAAVKPMEHYTEILGGAPASLPGAEQVTVAATDWVSRENAHEVPGLGSAALPNPSDVPVTFAELAFNVEGLAKIPTGEDAVGVDRATYLARYQTCPYALRDEAGNLYVFRVVEVDGERPPRSVDEVRDRVVADLRRLRGYERAQSAAQAFHEQAKTGGLAAAWNADASLQEQVEHYNATTKDQPLRKAGWFETVSVNRRQINGEPMRSVQAIGEVNEAFLEACFAMREATAPEARLRMSAIPESGTVVVFEWLKAAPLDEQRFKQLQPTLVRMLEERRGQEYLGPWLDPQQIRARNGFALER